MLRLLLSRSVCEVNTLIVYVMAIPELLSTELHCILWYLYVGYSTKQ